jgi:hypothetical protein
MSNVLNCISILIILLRVKFQKLTEYYIIMPLINFKSLFYE